MTRYTLTERIGVGAMAEVYRGVAVSGGGFEKPVAIKRVLPHLARDPRFVKLLVAEAQLLATMRQRNIVKIYDVGLSDEGDHLLVMEHVDGADLGAVSAALVRAGARFPADLAVFVAAEVCEALDHVHRALDRHGRALGLVHGNVSPSNVLLSRAGEVKLTDFLIARGAAERELLARIPRSRAYASPEQARGGRLDGRSDVYALGVVLLELVLGPRAAEVRDVGRLAREGLLPSLRELDPSMPPELDRALGRALARDPAARWPSAAAFGAALRDFRTAAMTAGTDPARELAALVQRNAGAGPAAARAHDGEDDLARTGERRVELETLVRAVEAADGEAADGEAADGEAADGEAADGEAADGEAPDGEEPDGELSEEARRPGDDLVRPDPPEGALSDEDETAIRPRAPAAGAAGRDPRAPGPPEAFVAGSIHAPGPRSQPAPPGPESVVVVGHGGPSAAAGAPTRPVAVPVGRAGASAASPAGFPGAPPIRPPGDPRLRGYEPAEPLAVARAHGYDPRPPRGLRPGVELAIGALLVLATLVTLAVAGLLTGGDGPGPDPATGPARPAPGPGGARAARPDGPPFAPLVSPIPAPSPASWPATRSRP